MLKINAEQTTIIDAVPAIEPPPSPDSATAASPDAQSSPRERLSDDVLRELTSWPPRARGGVFKMWHRGALSLVHLNVVTVLEAEGPLSMSRLAQALDVSVASATGIVDRMEQRGLVERRHALGDRRVVEVHPTEAAGHVFDAAEGIRRERLTRILEELSNDELAGLLTGLRALNAARVRVFGLGEQPAGRDTPGEPTPVATADTVTGTA